MVGRRARPKALCAHGAGQAAVPGPSTSPLGERNATHYLNPIVRSIDLGKRLRVEVTVEFAFLDRR